MANSGGELPVYLKRNRDFRKETFYVQRSHRPLLSNQPETLDNDNLVKAVFLKRKIQAPICTGENDGGGVESENIDGENDGGGVESGKYMRYRR